MHIIVYVIGYVIEFVISKQPQVDKTNTIPKHNNK